MNRNLLRLSLALVALLAAGAARAQTTGSVVVSASVPASCRIDATQNIAFGAYDPVGVNETADLSATGSVTLRCTRGTAYDVTLDLGAAPAAGQRQMTSALSGGVLAYELYSDAGATTPWNETTFVSGTAANMSPVVIPIYGVVAAGQAPDVAPDYTDTVTATVVF